MPLSVRVLARDASEATAGTARIYAWNTVGAIVGAVLAGFVLVPGLGFEGSIRFEVAVNFFLALWAAACVARPRPVPVGVACAGLAAEAMALVEQVMILAVDEYLHNLRATSARILGDAGRLVESSAWLATAVNSYLTASAEQDIRLSPEQLAQVRSNLEAISDNLDGIQDAPDPQRLAIVVENVNGLIRYVDEYPPE